MNDYKLFPTFLVASMLFVSTVIAVTVPSASETSITISSGGAGAGIGATTSLKADGASCSAASECIGGYCNSGTCASSAPPAATTSSSSSSSTTTTTSSAVTTTTPTTTPTTPAVTTTPAPTQASIVIVPVSIPVTETKTVNEVMATIKPADLGVTTVNIENVQITQKGKAEATKTATVTDVDNALETATAEAKTALSEIKSAVSSGSASSVSVSTKVEVFEVKEETTNKTATVSKITLSFTADKDLKNVDIVEVIPKYVAQDASVIKFLGEQPKILQADPIVQWSFPEVNKGESKDLTYQVNKKIDTLNTTTIAVAETVVKAPEIPEEKKPVSPWVWIIVAIIAIVAIGYFLLKGRLLSKKQRKRF